MKNRKLEKEGNLEAGIVILQKEFKEMLLQLENSPSFVAEVCALKQEQFFNLFQIFGKQKFLEMENF